MHWLLGSRWTYVPALLAGLVVFACAVAGAAGQNGPAAVPGGDGASEPVMARTRHLAHPAIRTLIDSTAIAVELAGIAVIVVGILVAAGAFASGMVRGRGRFSHSYHRLRADIGRAILLGLELLVAADIIRTVAVTPTLQSVLVLGLIVLIRTFLSFSLEVEITGRWPWQGQSRPDVGEPHPGAAEV